MSTGTIMAGCEGNSATTGPENPASGREEIAARRKEMETPEASEIPHKDGRGRPGKFIRLNVELPMGDAQAAHGLAGKRMRQLGEYVSLDRIISEAIQAYAKSQSTEAAS